MKKWLVTIRGGDYHYRPSSVVVSKVIELNNNESPIDWFLSKPKVYFCFEFVPSALLNFWEIR